MTIIVVNYKANWDTIQLDKLREIDGIVSVNMVNTQGMEITYSNLNKDLVSQFLTVFHEIEGDSDHVLGVFEINNLSCDGCANSAMRMLKNQIGVYFCEVNFAEKTAIVWYDQSLVSTVNLKAAVGQLGFNLIID